MTTIDDKKQISYSVKFTSEGKKQTVKLQTNVSSEILDELHNQGYLEVIIIEVTKS